MNADCVGPLSKELLTVEDVASILDVSTRTVFRLRTLQTLPEPLSISTNIIRWRAADIRHYLDNLQPRRVRSCD